MLVAVDPIESARARSHTIYVVHFWDDLIRRTLERVRRAHNEKAKLHKRTISIRFCDADEHTDHPVAWMQQVLEKVNPDYKSRRLDRNAAGYEDGFYGNIQLEFTATRDEVLANFLGLGEGLPIKQVRVIRLPALVLLSPEPEVTVQLWYHFT